MRSTELNCEEFIALLASDAAAPGGGGAAALIGALGTALGTMVASLTVGKPKFAAVEKEVQALKASAEALQTRFIKLVELDGEVFLPLSKAYGMPKETDEQRALKTQILEKCLTDCTEVPLAIMRTCGSALEFVERIEQIGTRIAISDAGCAAVTLKAALLSADLNVRVNTALMQDRNKAEAFNADAEQLLNKCVPLADDIYDKVLSSLCD